METWIPFASGATELPAEACLVMQQRMSDTGSFRLSVAVQNKRTGIKLENLAWAPSGSWPAGWHRAANQQHCKRRDSVSLPLDRLAGLLAG